MSYSLIYKVIYRKISSEQMNYKTQKRIQEMFRVSEVITVNEESITPMYKVRKNVEKFSIKENDLKEYLIRFAPRDCKSYIDSVVQKIYHPTENDYQKGEVIRLSSLR